ncbi:MAG: hypothetical protein AAB300_01975 [Nitrospirota bacterium]|mgnify:CR=1 FL=1
MILVKKSQIVKWGVLLVVFVFLCFGGGASAMAVKPAPPLSLSLTKVDLPNGKVELTFRATANDGGHNTALEIDLPSSVLLIDGEARWEGTLSAKEEKVMRAVIRPIVTEPIRIVGKATLYFPDGDSMVQRSVVLLNASREKPEIPSEPPVLKKQGDRTILEFKGK